MRRERGGARGITREGASGERGVQEGGRGGAGGGKRRGRGGEEGGKRGHERSMRCNEGVGGAERSRRNALESYLNGSSIRYMLGPHS